MEQHIDRATATGDVVESAALVALVEYIRLSQGIIESLHRKQQSSYELDNAYARLKEADMWAKLHGHAGRIKE